MTLQKGGRKPAAAFWAAASLVITVPAFAQQAEGDWHGELIVDGEALRVGVSVALAPDGGFVGSLVAPDQSARSFVLSDIVLVGDTLSFRVPEMSGRFTATWDPQRSAWIGTWTQVSPAPLVLLPGKVPSLPRPQEPKPPFPYRSEEVAIPSVPGVTLACTLTLPSGDGPFPAVLLISGSGPQSRDHEMLEHKPFWVMADYLTRRGIAVLRCDDRGTGRSTGSFSGATILDFAADAANAATWLRRHRAIAPQRVGLVGHSEGGVVATLVAQRDSAIAFLVQLAAPALGGRDLSIAQAEALTRAAGAPAQVVTATVAMQTVVLDAAASAESVDDAKAAVRRVLGDAGVPAAQIERQATRIDPWLFHFLTFDPRPALTDLRMPLLVLAGGNDPIVPAARNLPTIREVTRANGDVTVVELPGLNHLFQTSITGLPAEYGAIAETFSPGALEIVGDWLVERAALSTARH